MKTYISKILLVMMLLVLSGCSKEEVVVKESYQITRNDVLNVPELLEMDIESDRMVKSVEPEHPSGYYHYYEEKEGYLYYEVKGTIQNDSAHSLFTSSVTTNIWLGKDVYVGRMMVSDEEGKEFKEELMPGESLAFVLFYLIPDDETMPADTIELLFQKDWAKSEDTKSFDFQYLISLAK